MRTFARLCAAGALACVLAAHAQEATERHIPVGAYPALTSPQTTLGTLVSVDTAERTVTLAVDSEQRRFRVTEATRIWLDRSLRGQPTVDGDLDELATGLRAEVRVFGAERPETARWVKVQLEPAE